MHENMKNLTSPPVDKSRHLEMNYETPIRYKDKFFSEEQVKILLHFL